MKKTNLAEALKNTAAAGEKEAPRKRKLEAVSTSREGKKTIAGFFPEEVSKQLKIMAVNEGKTIQELLAEALNGLFTKYGKSPIA